MHPAFSVIFFTTLSGAGYGLLAWTAVAALAGTMPAGPLLVSVALALALVTVGLLSSLAHLGKPQRAWRSFSQWRTSWLSREGVAAVLTYAPALLLGAALLPGMIGAQGDGTPVALGPFGVLTCTVLIGCAALTVYCTAMIYASLIPIPAWRHALVVPVYFGFALLTGGLLLLAIAWLSGAAIGNIPSIATATIAIVIALWLAKTRYWRDIDATPLPLTRGDAVGLPGRTVTQFERPGTEANYITREMAFVAARRHSRRLRLLAVVLFAAVPVACMLLAWQQIAVAPLLAIAALSALTGAFVERWLFFAEAKHLVTLYY